jgi:xanthine dehydrogenase YagT iron-sulfur-binding subunit
LPWCGHIRYPEAPSARAFKRRATFITGPNLGGLMAPKHDVAGGGSAADDESGVNVSRRAFLKTVGVTSVAAGVIGGESAEAQAGGAAPVGPGEVPITLTVNGRKHQLQVEPRVTLLDALRDRLDHTGLKRVCDRGSCGACTAIIDGKTVYTCSMLAIEAQGKDVRTVEGLATAGTVLHPVQQAFCDHDGLMCGFCTPGFVMAAVALLEKHPTPTPEQARAALDGNICRCGTYPKVLEAVLDPKRGVARG